MASSLQPKTVEATNQLTILLLAFYKQAEHASPKQNTSLALLVEEHFFDLQETTAKIRAKTDHLKGVKIGIMGCIVNGPGEMADADYGYVGTGIGKICAL